MFTKGNHATTLFYRTMRSRAERGDKPDVRAQALRAGDGGARSFGTGNKDNPSQQAAGESYS